MGDGTCRDGGGPPPLSDRAAGCAWGRSPTQISPSRPGGVARRAPRCLSEVSSRQRSCMCLKTLTKSQELQTLGHASKAGKQGHQSDPQTTTLVTAVAAAVCWVPVLGGGGAVRMWRTQARLSHGHRAVPSTPISQVRKLRSTREVNSHAQSHTTLRDKM